jgi:hypothetical protein
MVVAAAVDITPRLWVKVDGRNVPTPPGPLYHDGGVV